MHEFVKTKEKIRTQNFRNSWMDLNEERNLLTNLNKPTRLHQNKNSKTSSIDNYMVISLKSKSIKIIYNLQLCLFGSFILVCKLRLFVYFRFSMLPINGVTTA